jgi:hypothetical protein
MLAGEKKKDWSPILSPIALLHNLIFIDTGYEGKSGFFESTLEGVFVEIVAIQIQVIAP